MLSLKIKDFINKVQDNVLIPELEKTVSRQVSSKEKTYWERSYTELSRLFNSLVERMPSFADVHIILEYNLPLASKYCDVILCGEKAGRRCCLVMELKHGTEILPINLHLLKESLCTGEKAPCILRCNSKDMWSICKIFIRRLLFQRQIIYVLGASFLPRI